MLPLGPCTPPWWRCSTPLKSPRLLQVRFRPCRFPNRIGAIATSVAATAQWLANFAVSTTFPPLQHLGLGFAYGYYTAAALLSVALVWFFVRETKGKELEKM